MIIKAYYDGRAGLSVNITFDFETMRFTVTRTDAAGVWRDRYGDRENAERRFNEFYMLTDEQLNEKAKRSRR